MQKSFYYFLIVIAMQMSNQLYALQLVRLLARPLVYMKSCCTRSRPKIKSDGVGVMDCSKRISSIFVDENLSGSMQHSENLTKAGHIYSIGRSNNEIYMAKDVYSFTCSDDHARDLDALYKCYESCKQLGKIPASKAVMLYGIGAGATAILNFLVDASQKKFDLSLIKGVILVSPSDSITTKSLGCRRTTTQLLGAVKQISQNMPILLICVESDTRVSFLNSIRLYKKLRETGHKYVYLWVGKGATHETIKLAKYQPCREEKKSDAKEIVSAYPHDSDYYKIVATFQNQYFLHGYSVDQSLLQSCQPTLEQLCEHIQRAVNNNNV